jgi:hypothetical protein
MRKLPFIDGKELVVDGGPFVALAGEIHNSSSSSAEYMRAKVWPSLEGLGLNTLLAPVAWEAVEPKEGQMDFSLPRELILECRRRGMRAVLLWLGLWKNAASTYVPRWMKLDREKYFCSRDWSGKSLQSISPFCEAAIEKDAEAFALFMSFLREIDSEEQTVLMIQLENEIGCLGSDRDYCEAAELAYASAAPGDVAALAGKSAPCSWSEAFGLDAPEAFMAFHYAKAIEAIAQRGKAERALPMYVNAWLEQWPWDAGTYPSGGPVAKMHGLWRLAAPSIDLFAPDIYVKNVADVCEEYGKGANPLFVPEMRQDAHSAPHALNAVLGLGAIGWSIFGIEDLREGKGPEGMDADVARELSIDMEAFDPKGSFHHLSQAYSFLANILPLRRKASSWHSFIKRSGRHKGEIIDLGGARLKVSFIPNKPGFPMPGGGVAVLGGGKAFVYGYSCWLSLLPPAGGHCGADWLGLWTAAVENGEIKAGRMLNGDERAKVELGDCLTTLLFEFGPCWSDRA